MEIITTAKQIFTALLMSFSIDTGSFVDQRQAYCLAEAVYFEARAESHSGKIAVASVIKNRVESKKYPDTYCGVVGDGPKRESWKTRKDPTLPPEERIYYLKKNMCAFSYQCDLKKEVIWTSYKDGTPIPHNETAWRDAVSVSLDVMTGLVRNPVPDSLHYANMNIANPYWAEQKEILRVIGNHSFFKD
jgi:spore germination cell wall hydrolase CwlJ-like protein